MHEDESPGEGPVSKSARKREATALQDLGVELAALPPAELAALELPDALLQALGELNRLTAHGAQLRQRQYIGKLMRRIDATPLRDKLDERKRRHDLEVRQFHRVEQWRARLLSEPGAVEELLREFPHADAGELSRLLAQAARSPRGTAGPRELFAWLRELMASRGI